MPPGLIIVSDLHNRAALLAVRQMLFSSALHELFSSARHKLFSFIRLMYLITPFDNVPLAFRNISS